ncbi:MAG: hypothetical protein ACRD2S_05035 [Terriglobales bacterium]
MRTILLCAVMLLSYGCLGQTGSPTANQTQSFDFAASPAPGPGLYAMPFVPLLATPTTHLPEPALQVGASNSTGANIAGAQNSTLSSLPQRIDPLLIAPRLDGVPISYDLYPRANGESQ